jgi:hypothetical protein
MRLFPGRGWIAACVAMGSLICSAASVETPAAIQALQKWRSENPDLFVKNVYKQARLDT